MLSTNQRIYKVESIKGHKKRGRKLFYLIKWDGFPDSENTWEPEENLSCPKILNEYKNRIFKSQKYSSFATEDQSVQIINLGKTKKTRKRIRNNPHVTANETEKHIDKICGFAADSKKDSIIYIVKMQDNNNLARIPSSLLLKWTPAKLAAFLKDHILF